MEAITIVTVDHEMSASKKLMGVILMVSAAVGLWYAFATRHKPQSHEDSLYALYTAGEEGDLEKVKLLIREGCPINEKVSFGRTPLLAAIIQDQTNVAEFLIESGANVNSSDQDGLTPLMWATITGDEQALIARSLIEHGATLDAKDKDGHSVFDFAQSAPPRPAIIEVLEAAIEKQKQNPQK